MAELSAEQRVQEDEYFFPYHFLNRRGDYKGIEYFSYLDVVKGLLKPFRGQRVLDAACGDGRFPYELKSENVRVSGTDYSGRALGFARVFSPEVEFFSSDLRSLEAEGKFDQATLIEALEHFPQEDAGKVLSSLSRALVPGGTLIVTVPSRRVRLAAKHYQHFDEATLRATLSPYFEVERIIGHHDDSFHKNIIYYSLLYLAYVLHPFHSKIGKPYFSFCSFLDSFYRKNLEKSAPGNARRLIVVCRKRA